MVRTIAWAGHALTSLGAWLGRLAGWLIVPVIGTVLAVVVGTMLRLGTITSWGIDLPLLGTRMTLTGMVELQWHLFAVMVVLAGSYAMRQNGHVRVDFVFDRLGRRGRAAVDLVGHLICLIPFSVLVVWLSLDFVELAYRSGEESDYGGLTDRYLIKGIVPVGFAILALTALGQVLTNLATVLDPAEAEARDHAR